MTEGNSNNDGNNNSSSSESSSFPDSFSPSPSPMTFTSTTLHTIPVVKEKPAITKQSIITNTVIEKRWVTKTEIVRVPVTYEEVYVNGKPMSSGGGILSDLKKALSGRDETAKKFEDTEPKGEPVPVSREDKEKVIPLFGEKIIITKKMTKLNDLVIRKRRVVENKKIKVNVTKENVKIKHPNGKVEQLST
jgi:stress response protein YsnF